MVIQMDKTLESVMEEFGLPPTPDELASILQDYKSLGRQHKNLIKKYETEETPVMRVSLYFCPNCMRRVNIDDKHCHWCGQRMGWKVIRRKKKKRR